MLIQGSLDDMIVHLLLLKYVNNVLAPKLQGDGGWVEFISFENGELTLRFRGECSKCLILHRCTDWIEQEIKRDLKKTVKIVAVRKRPYAVANAFAGAGCY